MSKNTNGFNLNYRDVMTKYVPVILLLTYIFYPTFVWMVDRWSARDSYFGHGFIIPIVSLFWIYQKRADLFATKPSKAGWFGLSCLFGAVILQVAASVLRIYFVSGIAFVFLLVGLVSLLFGQSILRKVWFPILFLLTMVPLPILFISQTTLKMKFYVSQISTFIINYIGIEAIQQGSYIFTPNAVLLVGDPCSGLRSFLAFLCLGLIFAYSGQMSIIKRIVLVVLGFPLAILSNVLRVTFLTLVGEIYGMQYTEGFVHDAAGISVFVFAFIVFMIVKAKLEGAPHAQS